MEIVVWLLVTLSARCFGHPLFTERRYILKREVEGYSNATISCVKNLYTCPETPLNGYGDPIKGQDVFWEGFFTKNCRYFGELYQCAEDYKDMTTSDPDCEYAREHASANSNNLLGTVCKNPSLLLMLENLRTCLNNRHEVLDLFWNRYTEISSGRPEEDVFCPLYNQLMDATVTYFKTCPETQFLWTANNEKQFRENFFSAISRSTKPFQCDNEG